MADITVFGLVLHCFETLRLAFSSSGEIAPLTSSSGFGANLSNTAISENPGSQMYVAIQ